jgi:phosphoenolpyruvate synthase/pyruvate phosphate dikinase
MSNLVTRLEEYSQSDVSRVGPKAASLSRLLEAGFPVPPGFVVTADAFRLALEPRQVQIDRALRGRDLSDPGTSAIAAEVLAQVLGALTVPESVAAAVREQLVVLGDAGVAVRSSSTAEDLEDVSFAGQYETLLGIRGITNVLGAIAACWRSYFSANALCARARAGLDGEEAMAVLVQKLIEAECAGVAFSVDPIAKTRDYAVVDAAWGMGAGVVDGSVPTDTYWVRRLQRDVERSRISEQAEQIRVADGDLQRAPVDEERRRAACLPEPWAIRIGEFALAAEWLAGRAQDVEWAIAEQRVWILQTRPVTGLPEESVTVPPFPVDWESPEDAKRFWFLSSGSRDRPRMPLEHDYMDLGNAAGVEGFRFSGYSQEFDLRTFNGRRYLSSIAGDLHAGDLRLRKKAMEGQVRRLLQEHELTLWDLWGPEIESATEALRAFDLTGSSLTDLLTHYEDALAAFRRHWMLHWVGAFDIEPLLKAYGAVTGREGPELENEAVALLDGDRTPFADLMDGLYELGQLAGKQPVIAGLVRDRPPDVMDRLKALESGQDFVSRLAAFLAEFGDRTGSGYGTSVGVIAPTWKEMPEVVLGLAAPYLDSEVESPSAALERAAQRRDRRVDELCAACSDPEKTPEFRRQVELYRKDKTVLEIHNFYIDQMAGAHLRLATMGIGRRFANRGIISAHDDVMWLRQKEIMALLREDSSEPQQEKVAERKADYAEWERLSPPPLLGVPLAELPERPPFADDVEKTTETPGLLRGQGGSPGKASGRARIVSMSTVLPDMQPGEILVADNAGPLWTPFFPHLAAIVLDFGSFGQHACATAREFGVPVVINTRTATTRIREGSWITVDGSVGTVELEDQSVEAIGTVETSASSLS